MLAIRTLRAITKVMLTGYYHIHCDNKCTLGNVIKCERESERVREREESVCACERWGVKDMVKKKMYVSSFV